MGKTESCLIEELTIGIRSQTLLQLKILVRRRPDLLITHLTLPMPIVERILDLAGKAKVDIVLNAAPA